MNYDSLLKKIEIYKNKYNVKVIGNSFFGRKIFAVERTISSAFPTAIFLCSIHAREHITTDLVCKMLDDGLFDDIDNFNLSFILMANPDGVELVFNGLNSVPKKFKKNIEKINKNSSKFEFWKANGRGVDLNNNFDANFGTNINSHYPAPSGYVGQFAESEPETRAIVKYTKGVNPFITLSYHSKGEEIYYNFFQDEKRLIRDRKIAEYFARSTGYIIKNPEKISSGGYKDYSVQRLKIPALTIEVGSDNLNHPIGEKHLGEIYVHHKTIASCLQYAYNVFKNFEGK